MANALSRYAHASRFSESVSAGTSQELSGLYPGPREMEMRGNIGISDGKDFSRLAWCRRKKKKKITNGEVQIIAVSVRNCLTTSELRLWRCRLCRLELGIMD